MNSNDFYLNDFDSSIITYIDPSIDQDKLRFMLMSKALKTRITKPDTITIFSDYNNIKNFYLKRINKVPDKVTISLSKAKIHFLEYGEIELYAPRIENILGKESEYIFLDAVGVTEYKNNLLETLITRRYKQLTIVSDNAHISDKIAKSSQLKRY